jgi:hypothetical protein
MYCQNQLWNLPGPVPAFPEFIAEIENANLVASIKRAPNFFSNPILSSAGKVRLHQNGPLLLESDFRQQPVLEILFSTTFTLMLFFLRNEEETQPEGPAPITRTSTNSLLHLFNKTFIFAQN